MTLHRTGTKRARHLDLRVAAALAAMWIAAGCSAPSRRDASAGFDGVMRLPSGAPAQFGFGTLAESTLIRSWNHDVRPDGVGLPAGHGSVADGARVYQVHCASCHGPTGREGPYAVLVGGDPWGRTDPPRVKTIGNYWPYATTLYDYIGRAMPQNAPGSLTANETYGVIAWLLARNGIVADSAVLDESTLPEVRMPVRDRFVRDDRRGGAEVR